MFFDSTFLFEGSGCWVSYWLQQVSAADQLVTPLILSRPYFSRNGECCVCPDSSLKRFVLCVPYTLVSLSHTRSRNLSASSSPASKRFVCVCLVCVFLETVHVVCVPPCLILETLRAVCILHLRECVPHEVTQLIGKLITCFEKVKDTLSRPCKVFFTLSCPCYSRNSACCVFPTPPCVPYTWQGS
jgi:hypothetical protein